MRLLHKLMNQGGERAVKLSGAQRRLSGAISQRAQATNLAEAQQAFDSIEHNAGIIESELAKGDRSSRF